MGPVYLEDLRQACFEYFKLGGAAVSGPVGLLSVYVELMILLLKLNLCTVSIMCIVDSISNVTMIMLLLQIETTPIYSDWTLLCCGILCDLSDIQGSPLLEDRQGPL